MSSAEIWAVPHHGPPDLPPQCNSAPTIPAFTPGGSLFSPAKQLPVHPWKGTSTPLHPHSGAPAGGQRQFPLLSSLPSSLPTKVHSMGVNTCNVLSSEPTEQPVRSTWEFPTPTKPREHQHSVWRTLGQLMLFGGRKVSPWMGFLESSEEPSARTCS